jgi:hypothetical protein
MTAPAAPTDMAAVRVGSWAGARAWIAVLAVLLYAAASTFKWVHLATARSARTGPDQISAYEHRFDQLRRVLPSRGVVGYLDHPQLTGSSSTEAKAASLLHFRRYLLAQYSLAPLLLVESTDPEVVVGNFNPEAIYPAPDGFRVTGDFGDGVILFRRSGP